MNFARALHDIAEHGVTDNARTRGARARHGLHAVRARGAAAVARRVPRRPRPALHARAARVGRYGAGWRSSIAGPLSTLPYGSKRDPWQGQSQLFSAVFQSTMHFTCVHAAERSCTRARVVLVDRDLVRAASDDAALARRDRRDVVDLAGRDVVAELERDVGVLLRQRAELAPVQRDALRVELLRPRMRPPVEQRR